MNENSQSKGIRYQIGDATRPEGNRPKIIVHVCNDVGKWGKGFVLALSRRWRESRERYLGWRHGDEAQPFALGQVQFVRVEDAIWVANLIGQQGTGFQHGLPPVRYEAIREGLRLVAAKAKELGADVHMPRIGCGLAGGKWNKIESLINEELISNDVAVTVYDLPGRRSISPATDSTLPAAAPSKSDRQLWGIYYRDQEYARVMGDPLRMVIEAPTKAAAEKAAMKWGGLDEAWAAVLTREEAEDFHGCKFLTWAEYRAFLTAQMPTPEQICLAIEILEKLAERIDNTAARSVSQLPESSWGDKYADMLESQTIEQTTAIQNIVTKLQNWREELSQQPKMSASVRI